MKKIITFMLAGVLMLSLSACTSGKPELKEVEEAIANGSVTAEDALDKGWVDEAWMEEYNKAQEALSVPASDKTTSNMIGEFETTTQNGDAFKNSDLSKVTFFAFINPNSDSGKEAYNVITENYDAITQGGGDVLILNTTDEKSDLFEESKCPVVFYNDSIIAAMGSLTEMVHEDGFSGSWNGNGAFLTAWNSKIDGEKLVSAISDIVAMVD